MPEAPPLDKLRRPFEAQISDDESVDIVGAGGDGQDDNSDLDEPENREPRHTRYDCGFVFENLWRSRNKSGSSRIWIPETIIFKNNSPTHWYFTRPQDGRIMKRNLGQEQFITPKKILEVLGGVTGEIAAVFTHFKDLGGNRVATTNEYFDRQALRDFLYITDPNRNGILQKFLTIRQQKYAPASQTNQSLITFRVVWTKGALRSTKVVQQPHFLRIVEPGHNNNADNSGEHVSQYQYATADPLPYGQITLPFHSHLSRKVRQACERMAEHMAIVSDNAVRMTRMVGYFKVGHKGQLWFNFPASVDVEDSGIEHTYELPVAQPSQPTGVHRTSLSSGNGALRSQHFNSALQREEARNPDDSGYLDVTSNSARDHLAVMKAMDESYAAPQLKSPGHWTDEAIARKNTAFFMSCAFCAGTMESTRSCSITFNEAISFIQQTNFDTTEKETAGARLQTPQVSETPAERARQMWSDMHLTEGNEITLPELRWKMKQLQVAHGVVEKIETGIALADTEIRGVVDFNLWVKGVTYSAEQVQPSARSSPRQEEFVLSRSRGTTACSLFTPRGTGFPASPSYLSGMQKTETSDSMQELLQAVMTGSRDLDSVLEAAAACGARKRKPLQPFMIMNLRSMLQPKLFQRLTAPGALERESLNFMNKNVDVCFNCHKSIKTFLGKSGSTYWDPQLEILLQPVLATSARQATTSQQLSSRRPSILIDRMWSRMLELSKPGNFPPLLPVGHTSSKIIRANENDLAWSNRAHSSNTSGGTPRSPPGKKPLQPSPRSRAAAVAVAPTGYPEVNVSVRSTPTGVLVQTGNVVKLLQELSVDELYQELQRRQGSGLSPLSERRASSALWELEASQLELKGRRERVASDLAQVVCAPSSPSPSPSHSTAARSMPSSGEGGGSVDAWKLTRTASSL